MLDFIHWQLEAWAHILAEFLAGLGSQARPALVPC
jgi:hypothetical protein